MRWTDEQEQALRDHYASETPVPVIAKLMGRSVASIAGKAAAMGIRDVERRQFARAHSLSSDPWHHYRQGKKARRDGMSCSAPAHLPPKLAAWFKAGWHDKDMELGYRVSGVAA